MPQAKLECQVFTNPFGDSEVSLKNLAKVRSSLLFWFRLGIARPVFQHEKVGFLKLQQIYFLSNDLSNLL